MFIFFLSHFCHLHPFPALSRETTLTLPPHFCSHTLHILSILVVAWWKIHAIHFVVCYLQQLMCCQTSPYMKDTCVECCLAFKTHSSINTVNHVLQTCTVLYGSMKKHNQSLFLKIILPYGAENTHLEVCFNPLMCIDLYFQMSNGYNNMFLVNLTIEPAFA